ncbi:PREDICTED: cytochrome b561 domain-containing protein 2-like isoform X1 [Vollenhovia emeryi]|uniref:cytochrome b561 domain-containing protein 2-like isoform X1 n=1 Tax=Vollenhovia emeryi TaxID=411798 RepID=UPI0005F39635|nr:PREDICTED: cytochrome b561 domain-containing protein 2-like isoform X1 [Vollenhovia emeryi]
MADKNNDGFQLQSTGSKPKFPRNGSTESIISSENREPDCTAQRVFVSAIDTINHILISLVTLFLVYHAAKEYSVPNIHVILCTIGYVLLMSEAIVVLASDNVLTTSLCSLSRRAKKHVHWVLQAVGLILNLVGVGMMYNSKPTHFRSIHGITGITSLVIICVVTVFGYPVWIAWKLRKFMRPVFVKSFHNFLGIAGFVIGMVSQCYGYDKSWVYRVTKMKYADDTLLVATILITILSLRGALSSLYRQAADCLKLICSST